MTGIRKRFSISSVILTYSPEDFQKWFSNTTLPGKWTDYYPKQPKHTKAKANKPKKVEEGGD